VVAGGVLVVVVVVVLVVVMSQGHETRTVVVPSESMSPSLRPGDEVAFDLESGCCERGDIVLFEVPPLAQSSGVEELVKRVVGLPGETVTADADGTVVIGGRRLHEPYLPKGSVTRLVDVPPGCDAPVDGQPGCVVPANAVFVLGDNREASKDSRVFGPVKMSTVVGVED